MTILTGRHTGNSHGRLSMLDVGEWDVQYIKVFRLLLSWVLYIVLVRGVLGSLESIGSIRHVSDLPPF